jgi:hypothetical protein
MITVDGPLMASMLTAETAEYRPRPEGPPSRGWWESRLLSAAG